MNTRIATKILNNGFYEGSRYKNSQFDKSIKYLSRKWRRFFNKRAKKQFTNL